MRKVIVNNHRNQYGARGDRWSLLAEILREMGTGEIQATDAGAALRGQAAPARRGGASRDRHAVVHQCSVTRGPPRGWPRARGRVDIIDLGKRLARCRPDQPEMAVRFSHATLPKSVGEFDMVLGNAEGCMAGLLSMRGHCAREDRPYGGGPGPV
jgi:hypothetical protein